MTSKHSRSENLTAVFLMVLAMGLFATADALIKAVSATISTGQVIFFLGVGGSVAFAAMLAIRKEQMFPRGALGLAPSLRLIAEVVGGIGFVSALAIGDLAVVSSVLQATPLAVTAGAALFLGEHVGIRRWSAVVVGFIGVLLIIQPGMAGFNIASVLALIGMVGLSTRDLATRASPKNLTIRQLAFHSFLVLVPSGSILIAATDGWQPLTQNDWVIVILMSVLSVAAFYSVTASVRMGEISFVTPFRYSRIVFAMAFGFFVFAEPIDSLTMLGITIVIASGLYSMWRENLRKR